MPSVVKHAWTHLADGSDPLPVASGLTWAVAGASSMTTSDTSNVYRLTFDLLWSNSATAFQAADVTAGRAEWIQLNEPGFYLMACCLRGVTEFGTTGNGYIFPEFESVGSPAILDQNLGLSDFIGMFGTAAAYIRNSDPDPESHLYTQFAFEWDPANPQDAIDDENPLKVGLAFGQAGAAATISLAGDMFFLRLGDVGMVDLSP